MRTKRRQFSRKSKGYSYRKLFIISCEGKKTEPNYFNVFKSNSLYNICIKLLQKRDKSAPGHVLDYMKKYLKKEKIRNNYEAWLVIDTDDWPEEKLTQLREWEKQNNNYGLAISSPKFEFWLLLHYEDGNNIENSKACSCRLKKYYPNKQSYIKFSQITHDMIQAAIKRAERIDSSDFSPVRNYTTVYKLVENILRTKIGKKRL